jgi:peroxiredoxin
MPLHLSVGDKFPDSTLSDDRGNSISLSEIADGQPLFVAFFRGPW